MHARKSSPPALASPAPPASTSPSLPRPALYHRARSSALTVGADADHKDQVLPRRAVVARSVSYTDYQRLKREMIGEFQLCIRYQDEALCAKTQENVLHLLQAVRDDCSASEINTMLATRALKYRHLLDRARQADVSDPSFDIDAFLRVRWCKDQRGRARPSL